MIKKDNFSHNESIEENLQTYCFEVGTEFENMSIDAAQHLFRCVGKYDLILDLGCGDGAFLNYATSQGYRCMGVDLNFNKVLQAQNIMATASDALTYLRLVPDNFFDVVFTHHALEHMFDIELILEEIPRVLAEGGIFFAIVPAEDTLHSVHHVVFESAEELVPPGMKAFLTKKQIRNEPEFICIAAK